MRKIISFCLWGDNPKYTVGAIKNIELAKQIYPDWICRFYIGDKTSKQLIARIKKYKNTEVVIVDRNDWTLMLDRFRPLAEPDVDVFISRDCDSRLSEREKAGVDQWLETKYKFHCMRDHPWHTVPILGGMWGAKKGAMYDDFGKVLDQAISKAKSEWQCDQDFLKEKVWPEAISSILQHASFYHNIWGGIPFPLPRKGGGFVGEIFDENDNPNEEHRRMIK